MIKKRDYPKMTLEEAIQYFEALAAVSDFHRQIAAWFRELQERRKTPNIVTCGECEMYDGIGFCGKHGIWVHNDDFCSFAERRIE